MWLLPWLHIRNTHSKREAAVTKVSNDSFQLTDIEFVPFMWLVDWSSKMINSCYSIIYRYNLHRTVPINLTALSCGRGARTWETGTELWEWWTMYASIWMPFTAISILEVFVMAPPSYSGSGTRGRISSGRSQPIVSFKHHCSMVKEFCIWSFSKLLQIAFILVFFRGWAHEPFSKFFCPISEPMKLQEEKGHFTEVGVASFTWRYYI